MYICDLQDAVRPKTPAARYFTPKADSKAAAEKPKKSKAPAPGTYDVDNCYRKTQWRSNVFSLSKGKVMNYVGKNSYAF